jgi:hypothetical protein
MVRQTPLSPRGVRASQACRVMPVTRDGDGTATSLGCQPLNTSAALSHRNWGPQRGSDAKQWSGHPTKSMHANRATVHVMSVNTVMAHAEPARQARIFGKHPGPPHWHRCRFSPSEPISVPAYATTHSAADQALATTMNVHLPQRGSVARQWSTQAAGPQKRSRAPP